MIKVMEYDLSRVITSEGNKRGNLGLNENCDGVTITQNREWKIPQLSSSEIS